MATNRRRRKEIIEELIVKKESPTHLSSNDLLKCETMSRDVVNAKLLMHVEEQSLKNMLLEHTLLGIKIEKQKSLLKQKAEEYEGKKKLYSQFTDSMWPKYGLEKSGELSLGYNDETGEIVKT